jgi:hypothetical protein
VIFLSNFVYLSKINAHPITVTSQDFIKFWGIFFAFVLYVWLKIHKDLKFLSLFKRHYYKTISNFLSSHEETSLRKTKYPNLFFFLSFIQLYASLLAKGCFTKFASFKIGLLFQTIIECVSQLLFYKLLFYYFRKNWFQTLFLLFYASKVIWLN